MIEQSMLAPAIHHCLALGLIDDGLVPDTGRLKSNPNERRFAARMFFGGRYRNQRGLNRRVPLGAQTRRGTKDQCAAPIFLAQGAIIYRAPLAGLP